MLMRDPMHQIDLGAIVHLIRAILRKFQEFVETALAKPGLAARKLRISSEALGTDACQTKDLRRSNVII